jgi:hypothetical protein
MNHVMNLQKPPKREFYVCSIASTDFMTTKKQHMKYKM